METNQYGFSKQRSEQLLSTIVTTLNEHNPYIEEAIIVDKDGEIEIKFRDIMGQENQHMCLKVNNTPPLNTSPFVPVYHTAQITVAITPQELDIMKSGKNPENILFPFISGKLPSGTSVLYHSFNFAQYNDEGGSNRLIEIAQDISDLICTRIVAVYIDYIETKTKEFKRLLR